VEFCPRALQNLHVYDKISDNNKHACGAGIPGSERNKNLHGTPNWGAIAAFHSIRTRDTVQTSDLMALHFPLSQQQSMRTSLGTSNQ